MRCSIVVPTYNEAPAITSLLDAVRAIRADAPGTTVDVLVVDDSSPDGTADLVRSYAGFGEWLHLLTRPSKDGLGSAYRAGFAEALRDGYDVVVQMDADGSHPSAAVPSLLALLRTNDVAIGSRYVAGGRTENWPASRKAISWAANAYARTLLGLRTRDTTSGFRAWRTEAITAAGVLETTSNGYGFQVENTWTCERRGLRLAEHPITFTERTAGASKMTPAVAREAALLVLRWRLGELTQGLATGPAASAAGPERTART
jgi:dolichol-phosphate mannosyltransferase